MASDKEEKPQRNNNDEQQESSPLKSEEQDSPETEMQLLPGQEDLQIDQEIKRFQTHILMLQGKAYLELRKPKHAQKKLETALKLNKHFYGEQHGSNASIYTILSQVHARIKDFTKAVEYLEQVWELTEALHGINSSSLASVHLELAEVYFKKRSFEDAISNQQKAFEIFEGLSNQENQQQQVSPEFMAGVALTLSEWMEKIGQIKEAMVYLRKVEDIYNYTYGAMDRRSAKVKRSIALLLLKLSDYEKALEVLREVEEVEKTIFGEDSLQIAKTLKVIGTIQIILNLPKDAREALTQAALIFKLKGQVRMQREALEKLKMLHRTLPEEEQQLQLQLEDGAQKEEMLSPSQLEELKKEGFYKTEEESPTPAHRREGVKSALTGSDYAATGVRRLGASQTPSRKAAGPYGHPRPKRKLKKATSQGDILMAGMPPHPPKQAWGSPQMRRTKPSSAATFSPPLPRIPAHQRNSKRAIFA